MTTARCVSEETLRENEELNRKVLQEYEDLQRITRQAYIDAGRLDVYERLEAERIKREEHRKMWSRWADIIAFIVIVLAALYFA